MIPVTGRVINICKTTEEWNNETTIISKGVLCIEFTTDGKTLAKVGDGINPYSTLAYVSSINVESAVVCSPVKTLIPSAWVDKQQTVSMNIDTSKRNIVDVEPDSLQNWSTYGIYASAESSDGITFTCNEVPTVDINFRITSMTVVEQS